MQTWAQARATHVAGLTAAVAFWTAAVIFVAAVSTVAGWLAPPDVAAVTDASHSPPRSTEPLGDAPSGETFLVGGGVVTFPVPADRREQPTDVAGTEVTLVLYEASQRDVTYTVGVIEYPADVGLGDPVVNLIASVSGAAGNVGGRVATQRITTYDAFPAVEFEIRTTGVRLAGRNVLVGRRLYLQNIAFPDGEKPEGADAFFASFEPPPA